ncbi:hypothetical protein BCR41DRAFT_360418 [Lobosporangium transversale]|uniref:Uncharacterized protein n=1 Tax=Lobosporangium transversale TaxID=64571 RepID=A0A1Y2GD01_9FUNG|nr:hypothetical protein BCR41DRAFT_360418 [Lobosporangium transversale]ORZ07314.1 hypothetical protein BCR41DRAFT_360418 [Lobosporangium transversale]|eukprot:XP_021877977.1 hypothetical protein BCR41DRAFT_360418 [Lobosporangium transversale]
MRLCLLLTVRHLVWLLLLLKLLLLFRCCNAIDLLLQFINLNPSHSPILNWFKHDPATLLASRMLNACPWEYFIQ